MGRLQPSHKTDKNPVIHVIQQSIDNRGKHRSSSQSNMYLEKYGYGQAHNVETQTKRSIQYPNVHKEISMGNRQNEKPVQMKNEERVKTIFKSKLGVEKHIKINDQYKIIKEYPENAQEQPERSTEAVINSTSPPKKPDENKQSDLNSKITIKRNAYNETKENILHQRKQKIDAIIEKAVKRALKFNGGKKNIYQEIINKGAQSKKETTTQKPVRTVSPTQKPKYAPILNPITGKPIGMVSNENGRFFAINEENKEEETTTESSKTTQTVIYEAKTEATEHDDPETTTGSHKQPQIDPTLESLTQEFMDLLQGEKSAISPPIYVR